MRHYLKALDEQLGVCNKTDDAIDRLRRRIISHRGERQLQRGSARCGLLQWLLQRLLNVAVYCTQGAAKAPLNRLPGGRAPVHYS